MLRKTVAFVMVAVAAFCLVGCTETQIEDLLVAPPLTEEQSAILEAVTSVSSDNIVKLKYPVAGQKRQPITFADLNGDGAEEAVVFFNVPNEDVFAKIAVLDKNEDGEWSVISQIGGGGTDVETFYIFPVKAGGHNLIMVEWSSVNTVSNEHQVSVYQLIDGELALGFDESCSDIIVNDMNADGLVELCYIKEGTSTTPFELNYVTNIDGRLSKVGSRSLNEEMIASIRMISGELADGTQALFIDEYISEEEQTTEVFTLVDGKLAKADYSDEYDIVTLARRSVDAPGSRQITDSGAICIPSETPPYDGVASEESWVYWYSISGGEISFAGASCVEATFNFALTVPESWLAGVEAKRYEEDQRLLVLRDIESGAILVEIRIFTVGESPETFVNTGFKYVTRSGSFRYYIRSTCSQEDLNFILENFIIL